MLNPLLCGKWDGCSVWLQWEQPVGDPIAYELQIRLRLPNAPWLENWMTVIPLQGEKSHWAVVPTWKEGWECQARVRIKRAESENAPAECWETASEVTFRRCSALFEFKTEKYDQHFLKNAVFNSQVDAAPCSYMLTEEIEVKPGAPVSTRMESIGSSGYHQLDYAGHFELRPTFGLVITNTEPSHDDVEPTGRDFTLIEAKPQDGPVAMVVTPPRTY
jgi:hypothetical protein